MILIAEIDFAHKNCVSFLMPTRLLCYCPVSAMAVRMHRFWTAAVRQRTLADIEIRECCARQAKQSVVISLASCVHFREKVMFLLLQLLLMVMLVVMLMVGSLTIWSVNR